MESVEEIDVTHLNAGLVQHWPSGIGTGSRYGNRRARSSAGKASRSVILAGVTRGGHDWIPYVPQRTDSPAKTCDGASFASAEASFYPPPRELAYFTCRCRQARFPTESLSARLEIRHVRNRKQSDLGRPRRPVGRCRPSGPPKGSAQGGRPAQCDPVQRQLPDHCHRRARHHPTLQCRCRAHAGLSGRRSRGQDQPERHS